MPPIRRYDDAILCAAAIADAFYARLFADATPCL